MLVAGKSSAILNYSVTTASDYDSKTDLSIPQIVYRDKGYYVVEPRGIDGTMGKKVKGEDKLPIASIRKNLRISKKKKVDSRNAICSDKEHISWRSCIGNNGDQSSSKGNFYVFST
ncbi:MAG: hypothetical protein QXP36_05770 [Conexivisphaerales archaeon]